MLRLRLLVPLVLVLSVACFLLLFYQSNSLFFKDQNTLLSSSANPDVVQGETNLTKISSRQKPRKHHVRSVCNQNGLDYTDLTVKDIDPDDFSRIYVDDKYKILYCEVPKVACTNWKRVLLILTGQMNTSSPTDLSAALVHSDYQRTYLRTLNTYKPKQIINKFQNFYKFMFVRDPLERLLSAFRNKFQAAYSKTYQSRYGRKIIQRYRKHPSPKSLKYGNDVTLSEFVRYLLDPRTKQPFDPHWRPFYQLCHPCLVKYDFIGKYETLDEDVDYILNELSIKHLINFPKRKVGGPSTKDLINLMFKNITNEQIHDLWSLYSVDYGMFGYSYPDIE